MSRNKWLDIASTLTLLVTVILFGLAASVHGLTHDLLLEAAIFVISVKLVLSNHKNENYLKSIETKLDSVEKKLK